MVEGTQSSKDGEWCSVIIPAHNESEYLGACLEGLLGQDSAAGKIEVIVIPNGCTDSTSEVAHNYHEAFHARGWALQIVELKKGCKTDALNHGDNVAIGSARLYLDADIICDPNLIGQLRAALSRSDPTYATGTLRLSPPTSQITKLYGKFWCRLPFVSGGGVGAGCYAVNAAGRTRWSSFPRIISDDSFARLQFNPIERIEVPAPYHWPLAEGLNALIRVRRRQDAGMRELFQMHPNLEKNESKKEINLIYLFKEILRSPLSGIVYIFVSLMVRAKRESKEWSRGR
jgi:glycosyltransferase involved in cell wall biosynthesis